MTDFEVKDIEEVKAEQEELETLKAELESVKDQYLRARAETENVKRRSAEDMANARKFAVERFAESLLSVADSLYAAAETSDSEGLNLTLQQLVSAFEKNSIVEINPEAGSNFDPHKHQAISTVESDQEVNTIVNVLQRGYSLSGRVLRPAMVTVSKEKEDVGQGE